MSRRSLLAACGSFAAAVFFAALPVCAQTATEANSQPAPETATAAPPAPPIVEVDPLVAQVRQQLAGSLRGNIAAADRAAVVAFYADRTSLIWVSPSGFMARARHAMAEIAKADEWGLSASAFELPKLAAAGGALPALADAEIKLSLAALKYARHARGGRLEPSQVSRNFDQKATLLEPRVVLAATAATETPGDYLRGLHPKHEQFERLRQALLKARSGGGRPEEKAETIVRLPDGPILKLGMEHPDVGLLRQRLKLASTPGAERIYDAQVQDAVREFQQKNGIQPTGQLTPRTRTALNGVETPRPAFGSEVQRLVVNMERWRWMSEDMGELHVLDNIPEFQTRVFKKGRLIHQAKIIVGKPETQTAIFSAMMRYIVFGPEWGVPDSIKVKELLPYLRPAGGGDGFFGFWGGTDTRILEKHNLRVSHNGRPVDASQVNWSQVDIRKFTFIQPTGPTNVLGVIKFRFPNKHDIYMHDTPQRELFEKQVRTFSHGCIRVHNPGRLAEILLEEDKGWSAAHVRNLLAQGGNNEVTLTKQIPVHVAYFTAFADQDGRVHHFGDIYGHDNRVSLALAGRPLPLEAAPNTNPDEQFRDARRPQGPYKQGPYKQTSNDPFAGLFGN
jgi:L,D-transpeptidase YcbB